MKACRLRDLIPIVAQSLVDLIDRLLTFLNNPIWNPAGYFASIPFAPRNSDSNMPLSSDMKLMPSRGSIP
jgi:hypothetical protein